MYINRSANPYIGFRGRDLINSTTDQDFKIKNLAHDIFEKCSTVANTDSFKATTQVDVKQSATADLISQSVFVSVSTPSALHVSEGLSSKVIEVKVLGAVDISQLIPGQAKKVMLNASSDVINNSRLARQKFLVYRNRLGECVAAEYGGKASKYDLHTIGVGV